MLTEHIGPIARIVIRKAALHARSTEEFHTLIADSAEATDRQQLLMHLRSRRQ